jgi:hypothetical protein
MDFVFSNSTKKELNGPSSRSESLCFEGHKECEALRYFQCQPLVTMDYPIL